MYNTEELKKTYGDLYDKQLFIENHFKNQAIERTKAIYDQARVDQTLSETKVGQLFMAHRFALARENVQIFVSEKLTPKPGVKPTYTGILLDLMDTYENKQDTLIDVLTFTTLSVLLNIAQGRERPAVSNLASSIGKEIQEEYNLERFTKVTAEVDDLKLDDKISKRVQASYKRAFVTALKRKYNYENVRWDNQALVALGVVLIDIVAKSTGYFTITEQGEKGLNVVEPTQTLIDAWIRNEDQQIQHSYRLCPTVIPPRPWTAYDEGGYYGDLMEVSSLLRLRDSRTVFGKQYLKRLGQMELEEVRKAINGIQATPWKINRRVLEVMQQIVKLGGGRAGLPHFGEEPRPAVLSADPSREELEAYKKKMIPWYKGETRRKSLALRALGHIKTAEFFKEYDKIYFPCNMDFRGRVYPIPSFNFQGDDLNKSLILFADAPACSSMEDIEWLMVHGANLAGVDKVSFDDRKQWVLDNEQDILASAEDPIGHDWWMHQDEPCQMLSFCFEWQAWKAWEAEHGTPEGFVSGIPIAFDGTCSGLQHFSAILRDPVGGTAVNLVPGTKPNDIYGIVAEKVNEMLDKDISSGTADEMTEDNHIKYGTRSLAQIWKTYGVTRKVTKRPTMTLAYGAKEYGFRDQIKDDTIDPDIQENKEASVFNDYNKWQASAYMAKLIWAAVGQTVVKAVEGMKWLQECAKAVTKEGRVVTWVTPMGLPVQQSYMKLETKKIRIRCNGRQLRLYTAEASGDVDKRAQASGIAPNFIHSMDAAHLQLTVCNCLDQGIHHFAMIHDSYGAPVAQAKDMFRIVRESFIQMYTENDVLENFRNDMAYFTDKKLPKVPSKGDLDITSVLSSKYIFS